MTKEQNIDREKAKPVHSGLTLLREPFAPHHISKLPKPTKRQTDDVKADFKKGIRCKVCGGWHHPDVVHLDYVGHAALTDRLLDCDPAWNWEPMALGPNGAPALDENGGMWIRLTVCGVTRLGYGHPDGKRGGDAIKEVIGDALRNAAMRFGAALDLWHKGQLHVDDAASDEQGRAEDRPSFDARAATDRILASIAKRTDAADLESLYRAERQTVASIEGVDRAMKAEILTAFKARKAALTGDSEIPY